MRRSISKNIAPLPVSSENIANAELARGCDRLLTLFGRLCRLLDAPPRLFLAQRVCIPPPRINPSFPPPISSSISSQGPPSSCCRQPPFCCPPRCPFGPPHTSLDPPHCFKTFLMLPPPLRPRENRTRFAFVVVLPRFLARSTGQPPCHHHHFKHNFFLKKKKRKL